MSSKKRYLREDIHGQLVDLLTKKGADETPPKECKVPSPEKLREITKFLKGPLYELYESEFFDIKPDEIRIRLRVRDGKVEMVVYALHQGMVNEFVLPFESEDVALELCG